MHVSDYILHPTPFLHLLSSDSLHPSAPPCVIENSPRLTQIAAGTTVLDANPAIDSDIDHLHDSDQS